LTPPLSPSPVLPASDIAAKALLMLMEALSRSRTPRLQPVFPGDDGPAVLTRQLPGRSYLTPVKLTQYASRAPCSNLNSSSSASPFVSVELFSDSPYHAHIMQTGAILEYDEGGVTFLHGCGRDQPSSCSSCFRIVLWQAASASDINFPWAELGDQVVSNGPWRLVSCLLMLLLYNPLLLFALRPRTAGRAVNSKLCTTQWDQRCFLAS